MDRLCVGHDEDVPADDAEDGDGEGGEGRLYEETGLVGWGRGGGLAGCVVGFGVVHERTPSAE